MASKFYPETNNQLESSGRNNDPRESIRPVRDKSSVRC